MNVSRRRYMGEKGGSPSYQRIEYLESTGTQYIDTNIGFMSLIIKIDCNFTGNYTATQLLVSFSSGKGRWFGNVNNTKFGINSNGIGDSSVRSVAEVTYNESGNTVLYIGASHASQAPSGSMVGATLKLFGLDGNNYMSYARVYSCKIYTSNDLLLFDFIPVRIGQVGYMYDTISGQLFGNAGTGDFVLGPDVTDE